MSTPGDYIAFGGMTVDVVNVTVDEVVRRAAAKRLLQKKQRAFVVGDLGEVIRRYETWTRLLPGVQPFYAMKANSEPAVLSVLTSLGAGVDCASKGEIKEVMENGFEVTPSRIIFTKTCKEPSEIRYAARRGIELMVFDSEFELHKIKQDHPHAKMLLRIASAEDGKHEMTTKFGCLPAKAGLLLQLAKHLNVAVVGISFHKGICASVLSYANAIETAKTVFSLAKKEGVDFYILDIGGGFDGRSSPVLPLEECASVLNQALDEHFPAELGVTIVAEPGKFFVMSAFTLCTSIISMREADDDEDADNVDDKISLMYFVNESLHRMFGFLSSHNLMPPIEPLNPDQFACAARYKSTVWGQTQDPLDCLWKDCLLPRLSDGDWLVCKDMGAYSFTVTSNFNGMSRPEVFYVVNEQYRQKLTAMVTGLDNMPT